MRCLMQGWWILQQFKRILFLITFALAGQAQAFTPLPANEAFPLTLSLSGAKDYLNLRFEILDGYFVYKDRVSVTVNNKPLKQISHSVEPITRTYQNETDIVYDKPVYMIYGIEQANPNDEIEITHQGCTNGFCYPPETTKVKVKDIETAIVEPVLLTQRKTEIEKQEQPEAVLSGETATKENVKANSIGDQYWLFISLSIFVLIMALVSFAFRPKKKVK